MSEREEACVCVRVVRECVWVCACAVGREEAREREKERDNMVLQFWFEMERK